jgi:hypothetical protein
LGFAALNANLPIAYFPDCARAYPGCRSGVRHQADFWLDSTHNRYIAIKKALSELTVAVV